MMMGAAREHRGRFIHDGGDCVLMFFTRIGDAIGAACSLQKAIHESEHNPKKTITRIGLATGWIDWEGGRYLGLAINLSDRLQKLTNSGTWIARDARPSAARRSAPPRVPAERSAPWPASSPARRERARTRTTTAQCVRRVERSSLCRRPSIRRSPAQALKISPR
jgi:class 3 adenylate cyclase